MGAWCRGLPRSRPSWPDGPAGTLSPIDALRLHGPLATPEIEALCDLPGPRAPAELWRLATEWRAKAERVGSGELWSLA